jgi:hypothetical protein
MRRPLLVLILCLLAGLLAWWELRMPRLAENVMPPIPKSADKAIAAGTNVPIITTPPTPLTEPPSNQPLEDKSADPSLKRAYMLSLDQGKLAFLEAQDIEGDFAKQRRKPEEWSGMLRCRLISEKNVVLAEELLPAPDHLCAVIDPKSGSDKPVPFTVAGPVTFQVRLPRVAGAVRLDISRIIQPADTTQPGLEGQLGSIPLPRS